MSFFKDLFAGMSEPDRETSRVAVVLSYRDIAAFEALLGKVPYEHAEPIIRALWAAVAMQRNAGLCDVVEKVLELHREAHAYRDQSSTEEAIH